MARDFYDTIQEARVLAMAAVVSPDGEAFLRSVCRWYARSYGQDPEQVEARVPVEILLQAYFEDKYENMSEEELDIEIEKILETPEQRKAKAEEAQAAKEADDAFFEETVREAEAAKAKNPRAAEADKPLSEEDKADRMPIIPVMGTSRPLNEARETLTEIPPDIEMKFVDDLDDEEDWDLFGPVDDKK